MEQAKPNGADAGTAATSARRRTIRWPEAFIILGLAALLTGGYIVYRIVDIPIAVAHETSRSLADIAKNIAAAFETKVNVVTIIQSTVTDVQAKPKLVVLKTTITVDIDKRSEKTKLDMNLGTTEVQVRAPGNKINYYVPLQGFSEEDIRYDGVNRKLIVSVPSPAVDPEVVEVQRDEGQMEIKTVVGWARLKRRSGKYLKEEALNELRDRVIDVGNRDEDNLKLAKSEADRDLRLLMGNIVKSLKKDVALEIVFK